jgi:uncharacterized protein YfaS (alpha-2-macroglobulin family)
LLKHVIRALLVACAALAVAGCHSGGNRTALEPVAPAPAATPQGPIASFAPSGTVDSLAQIRVIFRDDLIPLEKLESPDEAAALTHFSIAPALPGHFRFLTPRMIGFQADTALPLATRVRVTIAKGLFDTHGRMLANDFTWTFRTAEIALTDLPLQGDAKTVPDPGPLAPKIRVASNTALDVGSLVAHASLVPDDNGRAIGLRVPPNAAPSSSPSPPPDRAFDPSQQAFSYVLVPAQTLAKGTEYRIVFAPGIAPAHGNLASSAMFYGRLRTYGPLTYDGVTQSRNSGDRFDSGTPLLAFSNPIDTKTLGAIHLEPPPAAGTAVAALDDETIGVNPALLAPNTDYTVTIDPALADTFGQTLGTAARATFRTTDAAPLVWADTGTHLFPASLKVGLNVSAVNVPNGAADARFVALQPHDVVTNDDPSAGDSALFTLPATRRVPLATAGTPNVERTIGIPLRGELGGPAGVLAYTIASTLPKDTTYTGLVQLTNLGVFAQWFPDSGFVRVDHLSDGSPHAGVQVAIYRSQAAAKTKTDPIPCATGTTGADGIARFSGAGFAACAALDNGANTAPSLVTIVRDGTDWTYVRTDDSSGAYSADLYTGWSSATPIARGTMFSDRDLYQPGETAQLTAVGWFLTHGSLGRGKAANYSVELQLPNQEKRKLPRITLNAYGTASIPVVLGRNAPLGYYNVRAAAGNGETIDGSFRVAEFKPPNFSVTLALPSNVAVAGEAVTAKATSAYLFGSPVAGASTYYEVTRSLTNYTWNKDASFTFGRQWFWPESPPPVSSDVLQKTVPVDASGNTVLSVPVAADLPYPMTYRVDADTTDVANLSVGDSKSFTAFPGGTQIGLKTDFVATAGSPAKISVIALDPHGTAVPQTKVHLELQLASYAAATAIVEGGEVPEQSVTYKTVASTDVDTGAAAVEAQLTPPSAGTYRIRANVAGAASDATETDVQLYVTGSGEAAWGARDPNLLDVHLNKTTYQPGDVARAIIASPFPDADILVSVVRSGVLWQQRLHAHGSAPTVSFTVTPGMLPNAAFEAIAVRRGALPAGVANGIDTGNAVARNGFATFNVALDSKYLAVTATPLETRLEPGAHQSVHLHVTDRAQRAVRGQITVIVVNDAILQLSGYRPPDLVQLVYGDQPISTRFADNRSTIVLQTSKRAVDKGWGYGGGLSTGAEDTRIRRKFDPLAYYAGSLVTDANGDADASFDLPDDLTTWRVMAVAATSDGRFGNGETTFLTTKPLIVNPVIPQFARPGDRFSAGAAVTNAAGATGGTIAIVGSLTPPLSFLVDAKPVPATTFSAPIEQITRAYRFAMMAGGPGTSTATFTAQNAGAGSSASDGFAIPVSVIDRAVMESVVTTGVATDGTTNLPLDIAAGTPTDTGGVQLVLANSLIPDALVAANAVFADEDRVAIAAAGRLIVAADILRLTALTNTVGPTDEARARAATALAFLATLQRPDGGFASYPGAKGSDPFDSLEVLHAYSRAHAAGIAVNAASRARAVNFANVALADPGAWPWCKDDPCKSRLRLHALDAITGAGDRRTSYLGDIDAVRDQLDLADRIRLARLLLLAPGYGERGKAEARELGDRVYQTGALATFNAPERYRWFAQPVVAQALMTQLLLAQHADPATVDKLTRSLLALRRNGSWGCACQNAAALDALVDVTLHAGRPPGARVTAAVGPVGLGEINFFADHAASRTLDVPAAQLPRGRSQVTLALAQPGTLHYAVTYRYRIAGPQRGQLEGLRITRLVHPAGTALTAATMGLALLALPVDLHAAQVFDIELQVITDHPIDRVQITDPLPAGMEAVDTSFKTTNAVAPAQSWQIDDQQIFHDRIEAYADHLGPGIYVLHYLARTVTPGTFAWPGADVRLIDRPEEFGRTATASLHVQ